MKSNEKINMEPVFANNRLTVEQNTLEDAVLKMKYKAYWLNTVLSTMFCATVHLPESKTIQELEIGF